MPAASFPPRSGRRRGGPGRSASPSRRPRFQSWPTATWNHRLAASAGCSSLEIQRGQNYARRDGQRSDPPEDTQKRACRRAALGERADSRAGVEQLEHQGSVEVHPASSVLARKLRRVELADSLNHRPAAPSVREARAPLHFRPSRRQRPVRGDPIILRRAARAGSIQRHVLAAQFGEAQRVRDQPDRRLRAANAVAPRRSIRRQHRGRNRRREVDAREREQSRGGDQFPSTPRGQDPRLQRQARVLSGANVAEHGAERR